MAIFHCLSTGCGLCADRRKSLLLFFYTVCYLAYIALGGLIFLVLEGPQEGAQRRNVANAKAGFMKRHPCVTEEGLNDFLNEMSSFRIRSWNNPNSTAKWSYGEAVFFSVTLLTTIGYGHITPASPLGKAVCIAYSAIGIPMTLLLLAAYVQRLMRAAGAMRRVLERCLVGLLEPSVVRIAQFAVILGAIVGLFFLLPAALFSHLEEGWTFLDALYFCFISLTTVGLGDYVPGLSPNQPYGALYRFGVTVYVILGVTTMMFLMSLTAEFQQSLAQPDCETSPPCLYQSEKIPITIGNGNNFESYGSLLIHNEKNKDEKKNKETVQPLETRIIPQTLNP